MIETSLVDTVGTAVYTVAAVGALGAVTTVLWSPVLVRSRLRHLFGALPLTRSAVANYVIVALGLSWPALVAVAWAPVDMRTAATADFAPEAAVLTAGYVVGVPLAAAVGLPRFGVDWDPHGYGPGTWAILVVTSGWYAAVYVGSIWMVTAMLTLAGP